MEYKRSIKQPKILYENPVVHQVSKFLESDDIVNLTEIIREVDENVETIPTDMIIFSDCTDLDRLVKLPDLQQLNLEAGDNKESDCKMHLLYQLINLRNLWVNYTGIIDVSKLFQMRKLSFIYLKNCTLVGKFLPMHISTVLLENCTLSVETINSLASLEMLEELSIINQTINNGNFNTKFLKSLNNLTTLDLFGLGRLESNKFLKNLTNLETLRLYETTLEDYSPLSELTRLKDLIIKGNGNDTTEWLYNMTELVRLTLENFYVNDTVLDEISEFQNLEELLLKETAITTTKYFPLLAKLKLLSLEYCDEIEEYDHLSECKSLKSLALVGTSFPENILSYLGDLNALNLYTDTMCIYDYTPLANNKTIEILGINESKIDNNDMKILSSISNLELLKIDIFDEDANRFDDDGLEQLSRLKKMKSLIIKGNPHITSAGVSSLNKIPKLVHLNLSECSSLNYTIFGVLSTFPSLRKIEIDRFLEEDTLLLKKAKPNIIIAMVDREEEEHPLSDVEVDEIDSSSESEEEDFTLPKWTFNSK